jgi:hypothetical protein
MGCEMAFQWQLGSATVMGSVLSEMVAGMVSELEMASGMPSESKSIGHVSFEEIQAV